MKKSLLFLLACVLLKASSCAFMSRSGLNDLKDQKHYSQRSFSAEEMALLKNTRTLFLLQNKDEKTAFEKAVRDAWTLTPVEVILYADLEEHLEKMRKDRLLSS